MEPSSIQLNSRRKIHFKKIRLIIASLIIVSAATRLAVAPLLPHVSPTLAAEVSYAAFPSLDTATMTPVQQRLVAILQQEYALHPQDGDATVMKYTEGNDESWCADFISWAMDQADSPYVNPNSQRWRVPGVLTLQDLYKDAGAYRTVGTYMPKLGDVAFYIGSQTPDGGSSEHVAIVLKVERDRVTTIGGNESNGGIQIRTDQISAGEKGLVGFGISS